MSEYLGEPNYKEHKFWKKQSFLCVNKIRETQHFMNKQSNVLLICNLPLYNLFLQTWHIRIECSRHTLIHTVLSILKGWVFSLTFPWVWRTLFSKTALTFSTNFAPNPFMLRFSMNGLIKAQPNFIRTNTLN